MEVIEKLFAMDTEAKDQCNTQVGSAWAMKAPASPCRGPGDTEQSLGDRELVITLPLAITLPPTFSLLGPALLFLTLNFVSSFLRQLPSHTCQTETTLPDL